MKPNWAHLTHPALMSNLTATAADSRNQPAAVHDSLWQYYPRYAACYCCCRCCRRRLQPYSRPPQTQLHSSRPKNHELRLSWHRCFPKMPMLIHTANANEIPLQPGFTRGRPFPSCCSKLLQAQSRLTHSPHIPAAAPSGGCFAVMLLSSWRAFSSCSCRAGPTAAAPAPEQACSAHSWRSRNAAASCSSSSG